MTWPAFKFVSGPTAGATVRLDMSTAGVQVNADDLDLGVASFDGAPDSIGVDYGYRKITFTVGVTGTKAAALAVLQTLARELLRSTNWLLVQLQPGSAPQWFKTYQGEPGALSLAEVYDETNPTRKVPDKWTVTVPLTADGFAWGERETLAPVTINNDPAHATNPCSYILPTIKGDAPAPLRINGVPSVSLDQCDVLWSVTPVPAAWAAPIVWQIGTGDGLTAGTDTAAGSADASSSGGSSRMVNFATTTTMATRLSGVVPAAIPAGQYMVFLRAYRSDTASTFAYRFGYGGFSDDVAGSATAVMARGASASAGHATWVPLGTFSFPKFYNELEVPGLDAAPNIVVQAARLSGAGTMRMDAIILVPVNVKGVGKYGRALISRFPGFGPQSNDGACYWDGDFDVYTRVNQFGVTDSGLQPADYAGGFPLVYPGQKNVLHLLQQTRLGSGIFGTTNNSDVITRSTSVSLSYHPRYLHLRGD